MILTKQDRIVLKELTSGIIDNGGAELVKTYISDELKMTLSQFKEIASNINKQIKSEEITMSQNHLFDEQNRKNVEATLRGMMPTKMYNSLTEQLNQLRNATDSKPVVPDWRRNNIDYVPLNKEIRVQVLKMITDLFNNLGIEPNIIPNVGFDNRIPIEDTWTVTVEDLELTLTHKAQVYTVNGKDIQLMNLWSAEFSTDAKTKDISSVQSSSKILPGLPEVLDAINEELTPLRERYATDAKIFAKSLLKELNRDEKVAEKIKPEDISWQLTDDELDPIIEFIKVTGNKMAHRPFHVSVNMTPDEQTIAFTINGNSVRLFHTPVPKIPGSDVSYNWDLLINYADGDELSGDRALIPKSQLNNLKSWIESEVFENIKFNQHIYSTADIADYIVEQYGDNPIAELKNQILAMAQNMVNDIVTEPDDIVTNIYNDEVKELQKRNVTNSQN